MNEYTEGYLPYPPLPSSPLSGGAIAGLPTRRRWLPGGSAHRDSPREARNDIPGGGGSFAFASASASPSPFGSGCGFLEDSLIICGLVAVQLVGAAYMVLLAPILSLGLNPLFLVAFGSLATSVFTFPFAVAFEKKKWPSRISPMLMAQFALLALGGVTAFQGLMLLGMKKTSPAIAAAMPNLAPGFIFVIAACLRFEKVDMKCLYTRVKILGTLLCLGGAITMSFLQSPSSTSPVHAAPRSPVAGSGLAPQTVYHEWVVGCACLLAAVLVVSCNTVLQAATMVHFPAPFTLCAVTSMIGAFLTAIAQIISEGRIEMGSPVISLTSVVALVLLGSMMSSVCVAFQTWAVKRKGPVIVSMFSPTQTVGTAVLSAIFLGQVVQPGSLAGILVLFFGLYIVLWAKKKEGLLLPTSEEASTVSTQQTEDIEKPLLS